MQSLLSLVRLKYLVLLISFFDKVEFMSQTCPHCMSEIDDQATVCPNCHAKYRSTFEMNPSASKGVGFLLLITAFLWFVTFTGQWIWGVFFSAVLFSFISVFAIKGGMQKKWWN